MNHNSCSLLHLYNKDDISPLLRKHSFPPPSPLPPQTLYLFFLLCKGLLDLVQVPQESRVKGGRIGYHWDLLLWAFHHRIAIGNPLVEATIQYRYFLMSKYLDNVCTEYQWSIFVTVEVSRSPPYCMHILCFLSWLSKDLGK